MNQPTSAISRITNSCAAGALASLAIFLVATSCLTAWNPYPVVTYTPLTTLVEGVQPLSINNTLQITSPSNLISGQSVAITPVISLLSAPAGANSTEALGFVTLNPATLVFTEPNQTLTTTIQTNVPADKQAGDYAYQIATPGWPAGSVDYFGFVNVSVSLPQNLQPPSVVLDSPADGSTYTYTAGGPALSIPLQFHATATATDPLLLLNADVNGVTVTLSTVGLGTANATGSGTISIMAPGIYTVTARASNTAGTSLTTTEFTVNLVTPPPTVTIAQPALNSTYVYVTGAPPLAIPFSFSAASLGGGLSTLSATLNGSPVTVTASGLGTLNATGTGTLSVSAGGTYTFAATATTPNGTTSATRTFTVTVQTPAATVTISKPTSGAIFQIKPCCGDVLCIPFAFTAKAAGRGTISALNATLNGTTVSVKCSGLGTATATGTGTLRVSAAGTYTFAATAVSGGVSTVSKAFFTVQEIVPSLVWLPPISLGKVQNGGSTLPIKFQLQLAGTDDDDDNHCNRDDDDDDGHGCCDGNQNGNDCDHHGNCDDDDDDCTIKDTSVKIAIYEVLANGGSSPIQVFSYGGSPNPPTYSIDGDGQYQLNFPTAKQGAHRYHIDVYRFPAGSTTTQLLGTKEFTTR